MNGEYGETDLYISVPTIMDRSGAKEIVELRLNEQEMTEFKASCAHLRSFYKDLDI